jgi:hypothetical protein
MIDVTNEIRAAWAAEAIAAFQAVTGTDDCDAICDLIADLMHYANQNAYDFEAELARGRFHYEAELIEEAEPGHVCFDDTPECEAQRLAMIGAIKVVLGYLQNENSELPDDYPYSDRDVPKLKGRLAELEEMEVLFGKTTLKP